MVIPGKWERRLEDFYFPLTTSLYYSVLCVIIYYFYNFLKKNIQFLPLKNLESD